MFVRKSESEGLEIGTRVRFNVVIDAPPHDKPRADHVTVDTSPPPPEPTEKGYGFIKEITDLEGNPPQAAWAQGSLGMLQKPSMFVRRSDAAPLEVGQHVRFNVVDDGVKPRAADVVVDTDPPQSMLPPPAPKEECGDFKRGACMRGDAHAPFPFASPLTPPLTPPFTSPLTSPRTFSLKGGGSPPRGNITPKKDPAKDGARGGKAEEEFVIERNDDEKIGFNIDDHLHHPTACERFFPD
eukprot:gene24434-13774_t